MDEDNFLNEEKLEKYRATDGTECPVCGGDSLYWGDIEWTSAGSEGEVRCLDCDATWIEVHVTSEVMII